MEENEYQQMYELENSFWWYKTLHSLVERIISKQKYLKKNINILDAGCGTGKMLDILSKYGNAEGIDYSEQAILYAKKRGLINVKKGDLNTWNYKEANFDIIVCLDVIYHEKIVNDIDLLNRFYCALKKNGLIILNVAAFNILKRHHDIVVATKRRYRRNSLSKELKNIGFNITISTYRYPYLFFIILIKRIIDSIITPNKPSSDLKAIPDWVNKIFILIGEVENRIILSNFTIPLGSSLFIVAKKN